MSKHLITEQKTYLCRVVNELEVEKKLWKTEFIDSSNNIIKSLTYDDNGEVILFEEREYLNGKLIKLKEIDYENQIQTLKSFKYQKDFLIQERIHLENSKYYDTNYVYDEDDRISSINKIDESDTILSKEITTYDNNSQLVQFFDEEEYIFRQEETEFDNEDRARRKISEEFYINEKDEEEVIESIETFENDAKGNVVKIVMERYGKVIYSEESTYNKLNFKTEMRIWSIETDIISKYLYKYDSKGNVVKEELFENEKMNSKFEYVYNHLNQMIKIDKTYLEMDDYYITYRETIERKLTPPNIM